jgi:flagellar basal-body rod modification protein FlgD
MTTAVNNTISQSLLDKVNTRNTKTSAVNETQDRFMKLLVEQMKNQDPLNPMDNAQVTSQMAQLSTVTGIDKLNDTMANLMANFQSGQSYQASSMIGRSVLVSGNQIENNGKGGIYGVDLPANVDKLNVDIKNSSGVVVKTIELSKLGAGVNTFSWDGLSNDGTATASGNYTFEAKSTVGTTTTKAAALNIAAVNSVSTSTSGVKLNLSNLTSVNTSDVKEIF